MPELPEVETTVRALKPKIEKSLIKTFELRNKNLRWPVSSNLAKILISKRVTSLSRRAKYLIVNLDSEYLLIHLGMSGSLRYLSNNISPQKHDHWDLCFENGMLLRYTDPRRFGSIHYTKDFKNHFLIKSLGPEPLSDAFDEYYLYKITRGREVPIKTLIMNSRIVVGIGNIYACEALFDSSIKPTKKAKRITKNDSKALVAAIKKVLEKAIKAGGTTLRDYLNPDNSPGYFKVELQVYGRGKEDCLKCGRILKEIRMNNRSTVFCPNCQR